ncbi:Endonuclease/exonuclease/phosphatase [Ganoderma leucocontextum]|nr:Endonuclease/exonuclease/phosphatase [Ganoderma leucocontextum]
MAVRIATLNMNGFGSSQPDHPNNKWGRIVRVLTDNRIGVLLLQETHLTELRAQDIKRLYAKNIALFCSSHPDNPGQRDGVAIVLNKRLVCTEGAQLTVIVRGKAIQFALRCHGGELRHILCVYAPSGTAQERTVFFDWIREFYGTHPTVPKPDLMAGDFNNIEDAVDRLPIGEPPDGSVAALDELKSSLGLMITDGWRATHPNDRGYTFHRSTGDHVAFSRLDRIYSTEAMFTGARDWKIVESGIKTDHSFVAVQLSSDNTPMMGPGRPVFPLSMLKDKKLAKAMKERGIQAMAELDSMETNGMPRSDENNPQTILQKLKADWLKMGKARERAVVPKLLAEIQQLEAESTHVKQSLALLRQVSELKLKRYKQQQQNTRAKCRLEGDRPTKYWMQLNKEKVPRDGVLSFEREGLRTPEGEKVYEKDPGKMADMAREYHDTVQCDEAGPAAGRDRETDINVALNSLDARVSEEQAEMLNSLIDYEDCDRALRVAKGGTAPGLDGIQYEVWKTMHARYIEDSRFSNRSALNILKLLQAAFRDIQTHGVCERAGFADGWMSPIYKEKGERSKIVNYRPITLLNTDYKLLTKTWRRT